MFTIALEVPTAVGVNKILNELEALAAIEVEGFAETLNCAAFAPLKPMLFIYKVFVPVLLTEKVRLAFKPKSVKLLVLVVVLCGTLFPLPLTANVTEGAEVVVKLLATLPGLTQFEVVPVSAKLVRVPVLAPAASVSVVTAILEPEGVP